MKLLNKTQLKIELIMRLIRPTFFTLLVMPLIGFNSYSQNTNGEITYAISSNISFSKMKVNKDSLKNKNKELNAVLAKMFIESNGLTPAIVLRFNKNESIVEPLETMDNDAFSFDFGNMIANAMGIIYTDFSTFTTIRLDESFGEPLLVNDSLKRFRWKLSNEKRKINGYNCLKATGVAFNYEDEGIIEIPVEAWYAPEIPIPTGPAEFGGLPGAILELSRGRDKTYKAVEITFKRKEVKIKKPTKGKRLTRAEYEKLFEGY